MLVTTKIKIDLQRPSYPMVVNAVQGEQNTRQIELSLYSGCVAWMVPDNVAVAMRYSKPDKTKGYYDTMPDGSASFTVSENRILAFLAPQMLTVPGTVVAQIILHQGTQTLATFSIHIRVEADPSAGAVASEDYVNWAQWIKSELDAYLEQLKSNGEFVGGTFVGDVNMNGHALSGLRMPVAPDEAASKEYVDKNAGSGSVSSVAGVAPDANGNVPLKASDVNALPIGGGTMEGAVNMNGHPIRGLNTPTEDSQAATKGYVDTNKVDKSKVVNEFNVTIEGFVADARALKVLNDSKLSMELLWKNGQPDSAFPAQFVGVPEHDCEFYLVIAAVSGRTEASLICPAVGTGLLNAVYGTAGPGSGGTMIKNRGFNAVRTGIDFGGCYYTPTGETGWISIDNSLVPTHIYGLKGVSA